MSELETSANKKGRPDSSGDLNEREPNSGPARPTRLGRFEKKILLLLLVVSVAPLALALVFGRGLLSEVYHTGVNDRFASTLEASVDARRAHLIALRQSANRAADAVAGSLELGLALEHFGRGITTEAELEAQLQGSLERYDDLGGLRLLRHGQTIAEVSDEARSGPSQRELQITRAIDFGALAVASGESGTTQSDAQGAGDPGSEQQHDGPDESATQDAEAAYPEHVDYPETDLLADPSLAEGSPSGATLDGTEEYEVLLSFYADEATFAQFQEAGAVAEVYARLNERGSFVSNTYLYAYLGFLGLIIIIALFLAALISRRVTKRVTELADATRAIGRGDLSLRIPRRSNDEVGELVDAFNSMLDDLTRSQDRIEYLKRIGAWQEFARRLAHEIKNPLTPIQLAAQELDRTYDGSDEKFTKKLRDAVTIIEEEVESLRHLVGEFSGFAKLPAAELEDADLRALLEALAPSFDAIRLDIFGVDDTKHQVSLALGAGALHSRVDPRMLRRCLTNLVRNALQAMRDGGGSQVRVGAKRENVAGRGEFIKVTIDDDGPGIPQEKHTAIFDPYYTTKSDGTGLGLSIVKKVILEHGGTVRCEDSPLENDAGGRGARFVITLPAR